VGALRAMMLSVTDWIWGWIGMMDCARDKGNKITRLMVTQFPSSHW
jgi:hypothetical protein